MWLIGAILITLGLVTFGFTLSGATRQILEPTSPTRRTRVLLKTLKTQFGRNYEYIKSLLPYIQSAANKYGVDPALILAFIAQESRGNPNAISSTGAIGLMQIMPTTALRICGYTRDDLFDPIQNIDCGVRYIAYLQSRVPTIRDIIAAYYSGEKAVRYRLKYGTYPEWGYPPVYEYVNSVYRRYLSIKGYA